MELVDPPDPLPQVEQDAERLDGTNNACERARFIATFRAQP